VLKQQSSVQDYTKRFESIVMYLPRADSEELLHAYIYGLKDHIRTHLLLKDPQNLNEA
jgi:hypothetical protein